MKVKICPRCGSTNITLLGGFAWQQSMGITTEKCRDCNYDGFMPEVEKSELNKFKKKLKSNI